MLLFKHIQDNRKEGSRLQELMQVLPACSRGQIQGVLKELEKEGREGGGKGDDQEPLEPESANEPLWEREPE